MPQTATKPTKTDLKREAQDELLHYASSAFYALGDRDDLDAAEKNRRQAALRQQFERIEKLFGFEPGSTGV